MIGKTLEVMQADQLLHSGSAAHRSPAADNGDGAGVDFHIDPASHMTPGFSGLNDGGGNPPKREPNEGGHVGALTSDPHPPAPPAKGPAPYQAKLRPRTDAEQSKLNDLSTSPDLQNNYKNSLAGNDVDTSAAGFGSPASGPQSAGELAEKVSDKFVNGISSAKETLVKEGSRIYNNKTQGQ